MSVYTCELCDAQVERDLLVFTGHMEKHIVEAIKKQHPDWAEKDGMCSKCLEYYRNAMGRG